MTPEEVLENDLAFGREQSGVEFKGPGRLDDKPFLAKIARACLAMSNRRDGGRVWIGIDDDLTVSGLNASDLSTWEYDATADQIARYSDPDIAFDLRHVARRGKRVVLLTVSEFADAPIICKRDFPSTLRKGATYVRSGKKPESIEVPSHADMRRLLDLATDKALRQFVARANGAGVQLLSSRDTYDKELGGF